MTVRMMRIVITLSKYPSDRVEGSKGTAAFGFGNTKVESDVYRVVLEGYSSACVYQV